MIDNDIQRWTCYEETYQALLYRCSPSQEKYYQDLLNKTRDVVDALRAFKIAEDNVRSKNLKLGLED